MLARIPYKSYEAFVFLSHAEPREEEDSGGFGGMGGGMGGLGGLGGLGGMMGNIGGIMGGLGGLGGGLGGFGGGGGDDGRKNEWEDHRDEDYHGDDGWDEMEDEGMGGDFGREMGGDGPFIIGLINSLAKLFKVTGERIKSLGAYAILSFSEVLKE